MGLYVSPGTARSGVSTYKGFRDLLAIFNGTSIRDVGGWVIGARPSGRGERPGEHGRTSILIAG
jgi:hypothetical protein